ncbi:MAG: glycosyltransferase [Chloroflexi bacterium]|nr:glycosyltransferase [Chloroflexota bacterium]
MMTPGNQKPMNILYLCADRGIPVRGHKGAAIHVRALAEAFNRAGHSVTLMAPNPGPADGPSPSANIVVVPLPETADELNARELNAREAQAQGYAGVLAEAARGQIESGAFDFIYERYSLWSNAGARLSRETGLPLVLEVNAPLRLEASRYRALADAETAARIESEQLTRASAISVVSDNLRDYVLKQGAPPERVHVLPNAVDIAHFHPGVSGQQIRASYGLKDQIVIGFVGRPRPWHDLDTLLAAFVQLLAADSRFHLLLVGDMPESLRSAISLLGLDQAVTLTGPIAHDQVPAHIAAMDVAVSPHPPLADFYFSPLKVFEYLACGAPTVAADIGQVAELIRDGETGGLYSPGNADSLANSILALTANPARAKEIGWKAATHILEYHTWDKNAGAVVAWVDGSAATQSTPAAEPRPVPLPIFDHKLRQRLYCASRADLAAPLLSQHLSPPVVVEAIEVLKYKPGRRCVLAYQLAGGQNVIGKVFKDERGLRLFRLQQRLWQGCFGPAAADGIHVSQPLAYIPEMRMLLQERASGTTLNALARKTDDIRMHVRRSAQGIAKLHESGLATACAGEEPLSRYLLTNEVENLSLFAAALLKVRPQSEASVMSLRDALRDWAAQLPAPETITPVHRDFYYSQVLFDGPRLTLIDFDLLALGDPAIDAANFLAHLFLMGLDQLNDLDAFSREAGLFLETYASHRFVDEAFLQRMAFYEAATFFRLMKVVAARPNWSRHFEPLLHRTQQCLEVA